MRKVRITHKNALHHVMNKGIKDENIFTDNSFKTYFINLLRKLSKKYGIDLLAYVIMNNHYHLILRNTNNNLSKFMMELNGSYAMYYRMNVGGKGYVFQNRFKSTLIENEKYLIDCLIYLYMNPVRAGYCKNPFEYIYSSLYEIISDNTTSKICNCTYILHIFSNFENLKEILYSASLSKTVETKTRINEFVGDKNTIKRAISHFERRKKCKTLIERRRKTDKTGMSINEAIEYVERKLNLKLESLSYKKDKKQVLDIVIILRNECLLKYTEISQIPLFKLLKYNTLIKFSSRKIKK